MRTAKKKIQQMKKGWLKTYEHFKKPAKDNYEDGHFMKHPKQFYDQYAYDFGGNPPFQNLPPYSSFCHIDDHKLFIGNVDVPNLFQYN